MIWKIVGATLKSKMACGHKRKKGEEYFIIRVGLDDLKSVCKKCCPAELDVKVVQAENLRDWKP